MTLLNHILLEKKNESKMSQIFSINQTINLNFTEKCYQIKRKNELRKSDRHIIFRPLIVFLLI
jgi:hypothetical protein